MTRRGRPRRSAAKCPSRKRPCPAVVEVVAVVETVAVVGSADGV